MTSGGTGLTREQFQKALIAGSFAGGIEHTIMFPVDTVKTRLQVQKPCGDAFYKGVCDCALRIAREERVGSFYRGLGPVMISAVPSHGLQFSTYELAKGFLGIGKDGELHPTKTALAGACGVAAHDLVVTPLDVIKQRMQMQNSPYKNSFQCLRETLKSGGLTSLYRSYPITVFLNIPFMASYFVAYESMKHWMSHNTDQPETITHISSGACAGAVAGFFSNPPDVIKTRIQTSDQRGMLSVKEIVSKMYAEGGAGAFFNGSRARMLLFMPSAALSWTAYEWAKKYLGFDLSDVEELLD